MKGTIVKRIIRGKPRFYHQWRENGKTVSRYLKPEEILPLRAELEAAREMKNEECRMKNEGSIFLTGRRLEELCAAVSKLKKRALLAQLTTNHQPLITLSGAERSGKTVLLQQAIAALTTEERLKAAYLSCPVDFAAAAFMNELSAHYESGYRRFYLDAIERSSEVTNLLPTLVDTYITLNCRFVVASRDHLDSSSFNHSSFSTSPLSFADFILISPATGHQSPITAYLDSLGLSAQVKALAPSLSPHLGALARRQAIQKLTVTLSERMLKDVLIKDISARRGSSAVEVFTLELPHGGMDIVVSDTKELTCELYEVKFAAERDDRQLSRLLSPRNLDQIEHRYGMITVREVFYLGRDAWHNSGVYYRNAEKYLLG